MDNLAKEVSEQLKNPENWGRCLSCGIPIKENIYCGSTCEAQYKEWVRQMADYVGVGELNPVEKFVLKFGTRAEQYVGRHVLV